MLVNKIQNENLLFWTDNPIIEVLVEIKSIAHDLSSHDLSAAQAINLYFYFLFTSDLIDDVADSDEIRGAVENYVQARATSGDESLKNDVSRRHVNSWQKKLNLFEVYDQAYEAAQPNITKNFILDILRRASIEEFKEAMMTPKSRKSFGPSEMTTISGERFKALERLPYPHFSILENLINTLDRQYQGVTRENVNNAIRKFETYLQSRLSTEIHGTFKRRLEILSSKLLKFKSSLPADLQNNVADR